MASEAQLRNMIAYVFQDDVEDWISPDKERVLFDVLIAFIKQMLFDLFESKEWKIGSDKPQGNTVQDDSLIGAKVLRTIELDGLPIQMKRSGITFNANTGTLDFTAMGGLIEENYLNVHFFKKPS